MRIPEDLDIHLSDIRRSGYVNFLTAEGHNVSRPSSCAILVKFQQTILAELQLTPAQGIPNIRGGHEVWSAYLPRPARTSPAKRKLQ